MAAADFDDDDPRLTPSGRAAALQAFLAAVPPGSAVLHRPTFAEAFAGDAPGAGWPPRVLVGEEECRSPATPPAGRPVAADPTLAAYSDPLVSAALAFAGCDTLLHVFPPEQPGFSEYSLGTARRKADARLRRLLDEGLARFRADAAKSDHPDGCPHMGPLHSPANLALQFALITRVVFVGVPARDSLDGLLGLWRRCGVPGGLPRDAAECVSAWLFRQQFVNIFWVGVCFDAWFAAHGEEPRTLVDPLIDFPAAPFAFPARLLCSVPGPAGRPPGAPLPPTLRRREPSFGCTGYFGWIDPLHASVDPATREAVLDACVSRLEDAGDTHFAGLLLFAHLRIVDFRRWLAEAGLDILDVLCSEDMEMAGASGHPAVAAARAHPLMPEAVRRRTHLRRVLADIEATLPAALAVAAQTFDACAFAAASAALDMPPLAQQQIVGYLTLLRLNAMMLCSPGTFGDLEGEDDFVVGDVKDESEPSSTPSTVADPADGPPLLRLWFLTPSFVDALRNAMVISSAARMLLSRGAEEVSRNLFVHLLCHSATVASRMHLLVLRRFRWIAARAPQHQHAGALELLSGIQGDVRACLDLLEASTREGHQRVRLVLDRLLEGGQAGLSRAEVQMLRQASRTVRHCPHADGDNGQCWICVAASADQASGGAPLDKSGSSATLIADASLGMRSITGSEASTLKATRRRVSFSPTALQYRTYSGDEYPARSMRAPDHPEDVYPGEALEGAAAAWADATLASMMSARGLTGGLGGLPVGQMPNLRDYW